MSSKCAREWTKLPLFSSDLSGMTKLPFVHLLHKPTSSLLCYPDPQLLFFFCRSSSFFISIYFVLFLSLSVEKPKTLIVSSTLKMSTDTSTKDSYETYFNGGKFPPTSVPTSRGMLPMCKCLPMKPMILYISTTLENQGRRFWRCRDWQVRFMIFFPFASYCKHSE